MSESHLRGSRPHSLQAECGSARASEFTYKLLFIRRGERPRSRFIRLYPEFREPFPLRFSILFSHSVSYLATRPSHSTPLVFVYSYISVYYIFFCEIGGGGFHLVEFYPPFSVRLLAYRGRVVVSRSTRQRYPLVRDGRVVGECRYNRSF